MEEFRFPGGDGDGGGDGIVGRAVVRKRREQTLTADIAEGADPFDRLRAGKAPNADDCSDQPRGRGTGRCDRDSTDQSRD